MSHRRLVRPVLAIAAAGALALSVLPADAAPAALVLPDPAGDANGVNGQGFGDLVPLPTDTSTGPLSAASLDILNVTLASTGTDKVVKKGKRTTKVFECTGFTATLELGAAPFESAIYRITGAGVNNGTIFWLNFTSDPADGQRAYLQFDGGSSDPLASSSVDVPFKVDGSKVVFTVSSASLKAAGEKLSSFTWSGIGAHSRTSLIAVVVPQFDELVPTDAGFYTPCK